MAKWTVLSLIGCAVLCAGRVMGAGLGPNSYVQDGLVTQFDGIDNQKTGTHNSGARTWKDLKGGASVTLNNVASFGACWLDSSTAAHRIDGMPSTLKSNPITFDLCFNLIRISTPSTSTTWPSVFYSNSAYLHSTGVKNTSGDNFARDFRFYVDSTEPRPYTKQVYTNTVTCVSDATGIRVYQDAVLADSCTAKVARVTTNWALSNASGGTYVQAHYFGVRVYNRGLTAAEVAHNAMVDRLRFIGPRLANTDGASVNWSAAAWKGPYGEDRTVSADTNECVTVTQAKLAVAATDAVALKALSLEDGATLDLAAGAVVSVRRLFVEGVEIPRGIYTEADWLTGGGEVRVAGSLTTTIPYLVPQAAADGWYEFGLRDGGEGRMAGYKTSSASYHWIRADWPDFNSYVFPKGAKLRVVGYIALDTIPAGVFDEVDFSQATWVLLHKGTVFEDGSPFVIPKSLQNVRFQPGTWSSYTNVYWLTADGGTLAELKTDVIVNGQFRQYGDGTQCPRTQFTGEVGGSGSLKLGNYSKQMRASGRFSFTGSLPSYENGHLFWVDSLDVPGRISNDVTFSNCGDTYNFNSSHCANGLMFGKDGSGATANNELYVKSINGQARDLTDSKGKRWRCGGEVIVWGGNTVHVGTLKGSLHVVARRQDQDCTCYWFGTVNCVGNGNFIADAINDKADLFLSTNISVTVGTVAGNTCFNYTYQSNAVNRMTLDITNSCSTAARLWATDLAMLPSRLSGFTGSVTLTQTEARTYTMPIDFTQGTNTLYNTVGCIGSGTLAAAPETGTIDAVFPTTGVAPVAGQYALARFTAGGDKLANWNVRLNGASDSSVTFLGMKVSVKKDATGLWLKVDRPGMSIIIR